MQAFQYFTENFEDDPIATRSISFRASQPFSPKFVKISSPVTISVNSMEVVPFPNDVGVI